MKQSVNTSPTQSRISFKDFRFAGRALVVQENTLLFVSDDGFYWYLPGGRVEKGEDLRTCVEREVYEETGLSVKAGQLLYVQEMLDIRDHIHKLFFYFQTDVKSGTVDQHWQDAGGAVQHRRFIGLDEIKINEAITPRFLANGFWLKKTESSSLVSEDDPVYQGCVVVRGFEMVSEAKPLFTGLLRP